MARGDGSPPNLTLREHQVLKLIAEGLNHVQISYRLGISRQMVRKHIVKACEKFFRSNPRLGDVVLAALMDGEEEDST